MIQKIQIFFSTTKTKSSQRKLDVSPKLIKEIENYKKYIEQKLKVISNDLLEMLSESGIGDTLVARHTISEHIGGVLSNINDSDEKLKSE